MLDIKDEKFWSYIKTKTEKWIAEYPKSPTPYISNGIVMMRYAWKFRGGGWAHTVPEAWQPFRQYLNNAKLFLEKHKEIASTDPHWYEVMAFIAIGLGMIELSSRRLLTKDF